MLMQRVYVPHHPELLQFLRHPPPLWLLGLQGGCPVWSEQTIEVRQGPKNHVIYALHC